MSKLITTGQHKLIVRNIHKGTNEDFPFLPQNSRSFEMAEAKAQKREREILDHLEGLKGEPLTNDEIFNEQFAGTEDRDYFQRQMDAEWKVVKRQPSNLERIKQQLVTDDDSWKTKSRNQNLLDDIDSMESRNASRRDADDRTKQHFDKHGETLQKLQQLEANARWSLDTKNSYRSALKKAIAQLSDPDGDAAVARKLVKDVEASCECQRQERLEFLTRQEEYVRKQVERISVEKVVLMADAESEDEISRLDAEVKRLQAEEDAAAADATRNRAEIAAIDEQLSQLQ